MKEYYKVITVDERGLNTLLAKGWEVIETTKTHGEYDEYLTYHIGFPLKKAFELAMKVLKTIDKYDLRLEILEKTAEEIGEDMSDYNNSVGRRVDNSLTEMLEITDFLMSGVDYPKYYKQNKEDGISEDDFF